MGSLLQVTPAKVFEYSHTMNLVKKAMAGLVKNIETGSLKVNNIYSLFALARKLTDLKDSMECVSRCKQHVEKCLISNRIRASIQITVSVDSAFVYCSHTIAEPVPQLQG